MVSFAECDADEETEKNLRVLQSCNQQLVQWVFEHALVDLRVQLINVYFDLDGQDSNLISVDFKLIWLAVEG